MSRTRYVEVEVEADLDDFSVEELQRELMSRNEMVPGDTGDLIAQMWTAFYTGKENRAMEIARTLAETATGRMVPARNDFTTRPTRALKGEQP